MIWIQVVSNRVGPISVSFYEHGNETQSTIKGRKFLDELRGRQLFSNSATLCY